MRSQSFGKYVACLIAIVLTCAPFQLLVAAEVPLHDATLVQFASLAEAQAILVARDRFVDAMSPFDRQSRLETDREVSEAEYLEFAKSHAREWSPEQIAKLTNVVDRLRPKFSALRLPFPTTVVFIHTTGREEGGAAYCRGNAVILPTGNVSQSDEQLERLLTHELFHILSSHNPTLRQKLYAIIGFQSCSAIELPAPWKNRKITNPDAPLFDAYITLDVEGENVFAVPVLYANVERFDAHKGGPFFRYLTFRLMVVDQVAGKWQPVLDKSEARMLEPTKLPDYKRQIGANTQYIIHPEEIMADNFVHVVLQTPSLKSPQIVEAMKKILGK